MCRRITCNVCGKPSFAGCGRHIESVLGDVPPSERCQCREALPAGGRAAAQAEEATPGLLGRLFGRSPGDAGKR